MKKTIAILLVLTTLLSIAPAAAAQTFADITDAATMRDVAVLQMMEVVSGDGGNFMPDGSLTRAQFCKMAVVIMGRGAEERLNRGRTIFPDVRADHWARGYINLAVTGENRIMSGNSDGTFRPDENITYAQAVTILMRVLGYNDTDAGMLWPAGYLDLSVRTGLTKGLTVSAHSPIPRRDAAKLFCNMLGMETKSGALFLSTLGTVVENVVIMELDVMTEGGVSGAVRTSAGILTVKSGIVPSSILGQRGKLLVDDNERIITFFPGDGRSETVSVMTANARWVKTADGKQFDIPETAVIYMPDGETTLDKAFINITPGTTMTLYYGPSGKVDAVYVDMSASYGDAIIVREDAPGVSVFKTLTGGAKGYTIIKNGLVSSYSDIGRFDVATYNKTSNTLVVSDFRLSAYYEGVWPNTEDPYSVTLLGREFRVMPSAVESVSEFEPGQMVTALFAPDNRVAAFLPLSELHTMPVGVVDSVSSGSATVTLLNGMQVTGKPQNTDTQISQLGGALVTVTSTTHGGISLTQVFETGAAGSFDVTELKLGGVEVSRNVRVFDKVGASGVHPVALEELATGVVPADKIYYVHRGPLGKIDVIILNDITGDSYEYGFMQKDFEEIPALGDGDDITVQLAAVENSVGVFGPAQLAVEFQSGTLGGLAFSSDGTRITRYVPLTASPRLGRTAFKTIGGRTYVTVKDVDYPVADNVQCYNKATGTWFDSLDEIRAYSNNMIVYYDRPASLNGKIRVIISA